MRSHDPTHISISKNFLPEYFVGILTPDLLTVLIILILLKGKTVLSAVVFVGDHGYRANRPRFTL